MPDSSSSVGKVPCQCAVIWIDWYPYHLARFEGLQKVLGSNGEVAGIELVGGVGVHKGLRFRESLPPDLPVSTLLPESDWLESSKLKLTKLLWAQLNDLAPEVVLVPGYYTLPAIAAALWARLHGRRSVLMTESTSFDHPRTRWKEMIKGSLIRALFSDAVTGGRAHVRYLEQLGFRSDRIARFYDVVGNLHIAEGRSVLLRTTEPVHFGLPPRYFLYVGRFASEKNVHGLLEAWNTYREQGGTWSLVMVGDGPEGTSLRDAANRSPFGADALLPGLKSSDDVVPYFTFASCFVLPSVREPWGLVVNEAMAASLPVLVSNRCGCAEDLVVEGQNGMSFDPFNQDELVACLHKMERASPAERAYMGQRSKCIIREYSPESFGREIANICNGSDKLMLPRTRESAA